MAQNQRQLKVLYIHGNAALPNPTAAEHIAALLSEFEVTCRSMELGVFRMTTRNSVLRTIANTVTFRLWAIGVSFVLANLFFNGLYSMRVAVFVVLASALMWVVGCVCVLGGWGREGGPSLR